MHWYRSLVSARGEALSPHAARLPLEYRSALFLAFVARLVCLRPEIEARTVDCATTVVMLVLAALREKNVAEAVQRFGLAGVQGHADAKWKLK